jgi:membrane fusion protein, multidrug efflux system
MRPVLALLIALATAFAACTRDKAESKGPQRPPSVPVAVAPVEQKTMAVELQAIGTVEAYSVVSVRAQVGGELLRVHIKEGQDVRKGDLLFTIDPRPFEAAVAQAEATRAKDVGLIQQARAAIERDMAKISQTRAALARDEAQAKNAKIQEARYADLVKKELVAREQYDTYRTNAESLTATVQADQADVNSAEETVRSDQAAMKSAEQTVKADEANIESAKLQLAYTTIRSPINGRTGSLMLHEGNVVRASGTNDSTLIVINQLQPIYVSFTVPQQQLPAIKRYMGEGTLRVGALPQGERQPLQGAVTFIDNAVDQTTGTIRLKATFANEDKRLWPGQFVNVQLTLTVEPDALVVPSQALQTGQQGAYVFVVKSDSTVEVRPVVAERTQGSETIITKGLGPGETVVTDGQPRLVTGSKVEVKGAASGRAGSAPPGRPGAAGR